MSNAAWTWTCLITGVTHITRSDRGRYFATMREIVCLGSFMDICFIQSGGVVTCIRCLGSS